MAAFISLHEYWVEVAEVIDLSHLPEELLSDLQFRLLSF